MRENLTITLDRALRGETTAPAVFDVFDFFVLPALNQVQPAYISLDKDTRHRLFAALGAGQPSAKAIDDALNAALGHPAATAAKFHAKARWAWFVRWQSLWPVQLVVLAVVAAITALTVVSQIWCDNWTWGAGCGVLNAFLLGFASDALVRTGVTTLLLRGRLNVS